MNHGWWVWAGIAAAVVAATVAWGWRGGLLAASAVIFWMLLQFSNAVRQLRMTVQRPIGEVPNALMLASKMHAGMRLPQVLALSGSLGRKIADDPETYLWQDAGGDALQLELQSGRVSRWQLLRAAPAD